MATSVAERPWLAALLGLLLVALALYELAGSSPPGGGAGGPRRPLVGGESGPSSLTAASSARRPAQEALQQRARLPWCPAPNSAFPTTPFPANFWFVKTVKTGSSTLASIFNNVASRHGIAWLKTDYIRRHRQPNSVAEAIANIKAATDLDFVGITSHMEYDPEVAALLDPVLMFTTVRHPLSRMHSRFMQHACVQAAIAAGWEVTKPLNEPQEVGPSGCDSNATLWEQALARDSVDARWQFFRARGQQNSVFQYIQRKSTPQEAAEMYDFIFVAERMNEGLVLFMLEYGLDYEDIAYLPLKQRTGKYKTAKDMPQEMNDYILETNKKDIELWEIANKRLDDTRAKLESRCGAGAVADALAAFERLLQEVGDECSDYKAWYQQRGFSAPYTFTGLPGISYDTGVGFRCVRHVARRFMAGAGSVVAAAT